MRFDDGRVEVRLGFYIFNKEKQRWFWGRNATFAPPEDFKAIVDEATNKGWF